MSARAVRRLLITCATAALVVGAGAGAAACGGSTGAPGAAQTAGGRLADTSPVGARVEGAGRVYRNLRYAHVSRLQRLDLYLPAHGRPPFPVIVAIHGGGFHSGDKIDRQITPVLAALTRGYAVANLDYRLSGMARFPAAISDVKTAIRWLRGHHRKFRLDTRRFATWGDSAGGNLATLVGTSGDKALRGPHPSYRRRSNRVQAVVDWFGPMSFRRIESDFRKLGYGRDDAARMDASLALYLGASPRAARARARAADPATYISRNDPPILIEQGTGDHTVPYLQSVRLARVYEARAGRGKVTLHLLPGARHIDPAFHTPERLARVLDWLDRRLKVRPAG